VPMSMNSLRWTQDALALAEIAHSGSWTGDPETARGHRAGHCTSLGQSPSPVLRPDSELDSRCDHSRPEAALALATEAVDQAVAARDWWGFAHAVNWETKVSITPLSKQEAEHFRRRREQLAAAGAPHSALARLAAIEARAWLMVGDWRASQALLQVTLGSDPGQFADIMTRLTAALFAAWQDRPAEAFAHMERADELVTGDPHGYLNVAFNTVRSLVSVEAARAEAAYRAGYCRPLVFVRRGARFVRVLGTAGHSCAGGQAEAARDAGMTDTAVLNELRSLLDRFPAIITTPVSRPR
jgi:hypothetical protein